MLIEFSVANFRSLHSRQTFSLIKTKGGELAKTNTFSVSATNHFDLLRSAAIYGPNASGKSNFLGALRTMHDIVLGSANRKRGDKLPITPFRLSATALGQPSEFEVTFIVEEIRYQYGFATTEDRIVEEWLFAYPKGRPQRWFTRRWNPDRESYDWALSASLTGEKQLWQKSTRDNALFLSTAIQLNSSQLQPLYDWFRETLRMADPEGWHKFFTVSLCEQEEKSRIVEFLHAADLDIADIRVERRPLDLSNLPDGLSDQFKDLISNALGELKDKSTPTIKTLHKGENGEIVTFDLEDESDGTQKLFSFAGPWIDALTNGRVLFIDELHGNLHPRLVQFLIQLFHSNETNPKNAQLIFTTHETSILNQEMFRRDQIWFCEKNEIQSTNLYPLTDFSPRKGRENLELAYLSGRYGALPYVKPLGKVL
uniref:ATPase AAA-type core domain-containing protein n=1 Tax=Candidatus Kentrum sp. LPFa TaxID=2126335 RepID=A0A450WGP8_9GAMM|nr:MAG: hypothetical protein BECKLPF1236B_GA0070989_109013 [Candidatus Kentron sp. LPFa]